MLEKCVSANHNVPFPQKEKPEGEGSHVGKLTKHCTHHKKRVKENWSLGVQKVTVGIKTHNPPADSIKMINEQRIGPKTRGEVGVTGNCSPPHKVSLTAGRL